MHNATKGTLMSVHLLLQRYTITLQVISGDKNIKNRRQNKIQHTNVESLKLCSKCVGCNET